MDSVAYPGEGTSYGNVRFLETVPSRSGLVKKDSSALVGNAESTKGQVDSDHVLVKTKTIGLAKKKDSDSKSVSADHVLVKSETIGGGDKNKSISQVVGATKNVVGDNNVVVETNTTNGKKLNGATNIGEGIVLVTNHSGGTILAIDSTDSKLPVARSYSPPQGWDSIADVCLFGSVIFVPVMLFFLFRYLKRSVDKGQGSKTQACTGVVSAFFRSAFLNTVRLRHCRGEDLENLGSEGALYLAIHRETMVLVFIMAVLGCSVLFPLHLSAGNEAVKLEFTRSTIQHLNKHSSLLWVHLVFIFLFSLLYYRYVWKCRQHVQWAWKHGVIGARSVDMWDASVFVKSNMSQSMSEDAVKAILEAVYPGQVSNVVIIVDNSQALLLENKLQQAEQDLGALKKLAQSVQRQDSQYAEESSGESVGREGLDGTTREWTLVLEKEEEIEEYREQQRKMGENRSAGKCIVTFDSVELAARFGDPAERKKAIRLAIHNKLKAAESLTTCPPEETTEENKLLQSYEAAERAAAAAVLKEKIEAAQLRDWDVVPSPDPHDIIWGALHLDPKVYWCRAIIANIIIAIFLALVTTPASLLGLISHVTKNNQDGADFQLFSVNFVEKIQASHPTVAGFLFVFLPQLFIVTVNNALAFVIYIVAKYWEPHHTYSSQEISIFQKTFWFLLFNTLLVPALAFTSLEGFVGGIIGNEANPFALLGQVFVVTSGAFTLTYIITQTLVGNSFQLMNLPDKIWRCVLGNALFRPWASPEERQRAWEQKSSFDFGSEYATFLSVLALVLMFSTTVPIILPFGLVYFCVKIGVDEYQLNYVCGREKSHSVPRCRIGRAAVRYLPVPLLLYQVVIIGYFSSYVCLPNEIMPIAAGASPRGCSVISAIDPSTAVPGTQVIRGTVAQLMLLFSLLIYTASDCLYVFLIDFFNDDGMIVGAGFADQPFASDKENEERKIARESSRSINAEESWLEKMQAVFSTVLMFKSRKMSENEATQGGKGSENTESGQTRAHSNSGDSFSSDSSALESTSLLA